MEDRFLHEWEVVDRLVAEWRLHKNLIIAFDYDNTIFDYHCTGDSYPEVIELLKQCKEYGAILVCFTACTTDKFPAIDAYIRSKGIEYDGINISYGPIVNSAKIYFNILLDDRAGLSSAFYCLQTALATMRRTRR
jgi:hydroxymethylpyrimidine pyrophosphatase-like HAD family hydrolase